MLVYHLIYLKDPWILTILESLVGITKSLILSLSYLLDDINIKEMYYLSNAEEYFQKKVYGEVRSLNLIIIIIILYYLK